MTTVTPGGHGLGLIPDEHDDRDFRVSYRGDLPDFIDLESDPAMPAVWDQGQLGSCTAHGTLAAFAWASNKGGSNDPMLSRLQIYYNTRALEGTTDQDSGGQIRDAIKASTQGVAPETDWPYDIAKFATKPSAKAVKAAKQNVDLQYLRVDASNQGITSCLADGFPVVVGLTLFPSFESDEAIKSGVCAGDTDGSPIGGHCMAVVGRGPGSAWLSQFPMANPTAIYAKLRNSWGTGVYKGGYLLMPMAYLSDPNLGSDYWSVRKVS